MHKIIVTDKLAQEGVRVLEDSGFDVDCKYGIEPDELKKIIKDYEVIIVRSQTKVSEAFLAVQQIVSKGTVQAEEVRRQLNKKT